MRTAENKLMRIACNTGMNQSVDDEYAPPGTFVTVNNIRFKGHGVMEKRVGTRALDGSVFSSQATYKDFVGDAVSSFPEAPAFITSQNDRTPMIGTTLGDLWAVDEVDFFRFQGKFSSAKPLREIPGLSGSWNDVSAGLSGAVLAVNTDGYVLCAAMDGSSYMHVQITSPEGIVIYHWTTLGQAVQPGFKAIAMGTDFRVLYQHSTSTTLRCKKILCPGGIIIESDLSVATLRSATSPFDVTAYDSARWFIIYESALDTCRVDRFSDDSSTHNTTWAVTSPFPVSIWADSTKGTGVWCGYVNDHIATGNVRYRVRLATDLTSVLGETTIVTGASLFGPPLFGYLYRPLSGYGATGIAFFVIHYNNTGANANVSTYYGTATDAGVVGTLRFTTGCCPASKPDNYNRCWVRVTREPIDFNFQSTIRYALLRFNPEPAVVTNLSNPIIELATPLMIHDGMTPQVGGSVEPGGITNAGRTATTSYFAFQRVLAGIPQEAALSRKYISQLAIYAYTVSDQDAHVATEAFNGTLCMAGQPTESYGQPAARFRTGSTGTVWGLQDSGCVEIGFIDAPAVTLSAISSSGSNLIGTYSYRVVYQWADVLGRRHRSAPSDPVSITHTINRGTRLTCRALYIGQRQTESVALNATLEVYRTVSGGATYFLVGTHAIAYDFTIASPTITIDDDVYPDTAIQNGHEILYTDGGVLPNDLAPSCRFMARSEDRLWCGGLFQSNVIQCSKVVVPGEPVQFTDHDSHRVNIYDDCTGLAYQDGTLIAFTPTSILLISGDGPNDQGAGSFTTPRELSRDVGCIDYRSILQTNNGVFFQSRLGLYLIPRGMGAPVFVGERIRRYFDALALGSSSPYPGTVLSAAVGQANGNHLARWLVAGTGNTSSNTILTYDLVNDQWVLDRIGENYFFPPAPYISNIKEIGFWPRGFAYARASLLSTNTNNVLIDDSSYTGDSSDAYLILEKAETAWIYPFDVGGYGALNQALLSASSSAAQNNSRQLVVYTDNTSEADNAASSFWTGTPSNVASGGLSWMAVTPKKKQGTRFKLVYSDVPHNSNTPDAGVKLLAFTLDVENSNGIRLITAMERG